MRPAEPRSADLDGPDITLGSALRGAQASLAEAGFAEAHREAELLLVEATDTGRSTLYAWPERPLDAGQGRRFRELLRRRLTGEPMAYILGRTGFHAIELAIGPGALIPRAETELLVDWALEAGPADAAVACADLGTGSGAIALAIARQRPAWHLLAVERNPEALRIAERNRQHLGTANVQLVQGDWLDGFAPSSLDLIVGNPPYVRARDPHLTRGDLPFEPASALASGTDGLRAIRRIMAQACRVLRPEGRLLLEHGWDQGAEVRALFHLGGWRAIVTRRDLAGLERATGAAPPPAANARIG